jgi:hypothetical protein
MCFMSRIGCTVIAAVMLVYGAGCTMFEATGPDPDAPQCGAPPPRLAGVWSATVLDAPLTLSMQEQCFRVFGSASWLASGAWSWGTAVTGATVWVTYGASPTTVLQLSALPTTDFVRGVTITIEGQQPFGATLVGVADGELPTSPARTTWIRVDQVPVVLKR